jgi:MFS family permease
VVLAGAVLVGLGIVLASRATSLLEFQLVYGILVGLAAGAFFAPMMSTVTSWFEENRGLAVGLVSAGTAVAPLTVSPFASWLISTHDWRTAQLVIGLFAWALLVPAALLVRAAPVKAARPGGVPASDMPGLTVGKALRSRAFIVLALTFFACCATHSGPIFHTISYAVTCGIAPMTAVSIYGIEGLAGLGGRILLGTLADRHGVRPVLVAGLLVQAVGAATYAGASQLGQFYIVAVVFGLAYGGVMPLYAVLAREYFGPRIMGTVFGAAAMISSLGMALGPPLGGWVFDHFGSYAWLYLGSGMIGIGAAAMALAFPPQPSRQCRLPEPAVVAG